MSYAYLWDVYDMNNKFGPNIAKENKLATYLTLYGDIEDYYYLAYISKDTIANGMEWLSNYEKNYASQLLECSCCYFQCSVIG